MKIKMFTKLFFALLLSIGIMSCMKDSNTDSNSDQVKVGIISAIINGNVFESKTGVGIINDGIDGFTDVLTIVGSENVANPLEKHLSILIYNASNKPLMADTYDGKFGNCTESGACVYMSYGIESEDEFYTSEDNFQVSFSSLNYMPNGYVIGSFSGSIIDEDEEVVLKVENGKFNVKILE